MSLYDAFRKILARECRIPWNYYGVFSDYGDELFYDEDEAERFIRSIFESGSKQAIIEQMKFDTDELAFRAKHTIKVFLLGLMLQEIIDPELCIRTDELDIGDYEFSYLWYLVCLYHDAGYKYENKKGNKEIEKKCLQLIDSKYRYEDRRKMMGIGLSLQLKRQIYCMNGVEVALKCSKKYCDCESCGCSGKRMSAIPECRKNYVKFNNGRACKIYHSLGIYKDDYFAYRYFEGEVDKNTNELKHLIDHGIVGADMLKKGFCTDYINNFERTREMFPDTKFYTFQNESNRRFCCEQFKIFAYLADCIACHNIWKCEEDDEKRKEIYRRFRLENLIGERFKKVNYERNPILFILCLADSLEPSKKFAETNIGDVELLKNISITYSKEDNVVKVILHKELKEYETECRDYISKINGIEKWIDVTIEGDKEW